MTPSCMYMRACTLGALLSLALAAPCMAGAQTTFAWPVRNLDDARYASPEQCVALSERLQANAWGWSADAMRDTLPFDPQDTLPAALVLAVRTCVAKFALERAAPLELPWLLSLDLVAREDEQAKRVVARALALAGTKTARANVLNATIATLLAARPARVADAVSYAAQVDALTGVADAARREVHRQLARYAISVLDTTLLVAQLAAYRASDDFVDLLPLTQLRMLRQRTPDERVAIRELVTARATAAGATMSPQGLNAQLGETLNRVAPPGRPVVAADFWFASPPDDTIRPAPGKVSLLVFVGVRCAIVADACAPEYAVLRRLHQRFGNALDITLMARTEGYFRKYPPPTPPEEAELLRQFFLEDVGLSGALSVIATPFMRLPDPDRRRRDGATPNLRYFGWIEQDGLDNRGAERILSAFLVGPDGEVKARLDCEPDTERLLAALAAKMVDATGVH
jgi:hypothetical protein